MCVLAFAWNAHSDWPLVVIGNRDELHARPAAPLARWDNPSHIIAGRDIEQGGTWLGVSAEGRLAVITNRANPNGRAPDKASRGALVLDVLAGTGRYARPRENDLEDFNPFNLITVDGNSAQFLSNRPGPLRTRLGPGLYGLSNGALDDPWPKIERIKAMLEDWLRSGKDDQGALLDWMRSDDSPQVEPRQADLSPIFIRNPVYGTRCSTIAAVNARGKGWIVERSYDAEGTPTGETRIAFDWPRERLSA
ncbi:NRDE family protein [Parasphingopyxis marina]|uniref:NRDE family protein n=1 Tax=Parasphingopyxis marina TaxID=2761622 RepID=A0A842HYQ9_9SPHN|nr:NRDE family protein [Parasphingopyxis marina]MBC2777975.1 NRDE family protein [Parasphingopyxis marina]